MSNEYKKIDEYNNVHLPCIQYLERQYPNVYFYSDLNGVRVRPKRAGEIKAIQMKNRKWLDIFIAEPRHGFAGCFIELKDGYDVLYTKKDERRNSEHINAQAETIEAMKARGFAATFCTSVESLSSWLIGILKKT